MVSISNLFFLKQNIAREFRDSPPKWKLVQNLKLLGNLAFQQLLAIVRLQHFSIIAAAFFTMRKRERERGERKYDGCIVEIMGLSVGMVPIPEGILLLWRIVYLSSSYKEIHLHPLQFTVLIYLV